MRVAGLGAELPSAAAAVVVSAVQNKTVVEGGWAVNDDVAVSTVTTRGAGVPLWG